MSLVDLGKRLLEKAKLGETDEVRALMTNGAPFTTDWLGTSALHMAAQNGHVSTAEVLLRGGISRDARTKVDRTPLHIAAQEGHLEIVKLLLSHCSEVDARDMLRMTPLHWCVERGHYHVAKLLLTNNADIHALSKFDKTPLDIAEDNGQLHLIELLTRHAVQAANLPKKQQQTKAKIIHKIQSNLNFGGQTIKTGVPFFLRAENLPSTTTHRTLTHAVQVTSPITYVTSPTSVSNIQTSSVKSPTLTKPMLFRANLANLQKTAAASTSVRASSSSDSEEGESSEQGSTNILATLAALAEATAPNATISTSEAMQWLEMNGITMLPTDNSSVVASALEGGQTVALTEAGKLALTWVKEHQNLNNSQNLASVSTTKDETIARTSGGHSTTSQKIITLVANQTHIPSIVSTQQSPIVVLSSNIPSSDLPPSAKKMKTVTVKNDCKSLTNGSSLSSISSEDDERSKLKEELEKIRREAEQFKAQFLQKEREAEEYRKQLEQMKTLPSVSQ